MDLTSRLISQITYRALYQLSYSQRMVRCFLVSSAVFQTIYLFFLIDSKNSYKFNSLANSYNFVQKNKSHQYLPDLQRLCSFSQLSIDILMGDNQIIIKKLIQIISSNKEGICREHKNTAELICFHDQCTERLMCMLCQHNHQLFTSVRIKSHVELKLFKKRVDESIDRSLKVIDNIEKGGIQNQKKLVAQYYDSIKADLIKFLDLRMNENLSLFNPKKSSNLQALIRSRIQGRYHELPLQMFLKIKQVYQGKDLQTIARQQQQENLQTAYNYMKQFHDECKSLFQRFKIHLKVSVPQIRIKSGQDLFNNRLHVQSYDEQVIKNRLKQQIKYSSNVDIQLMISDAFSGKKQVITVGFDKIMRVFDKNLRIVHSKEYNNILTKIQPIGDSVFAVGVSKQLHINKISYEEGYDPKPILILKGHTQKIWDISSFNTRIIGSCSEEGTKIWDLYKEKCQYTLRQLINPSCLRFMTAAQLLAVGYHSHQLKIYSINTMKPTRSYQLSGVPLYLSQQNRNQNVIYCGGFSSDLKLFDIRVSKQVFNHNFKSEAVTTFKESVFDQQNILIGERGGKARVFDLRKLKTRLQWQAHQKMTNLSKPNGVIRIFEEGFNEVLTVGSNDRKAKVWELLNLQ